MVLIKHSKKIKSRKHIRLNKNKKRSFKNKKYKTIKSNKFLKHISILNQNGGDDVLTSNETNKYFSNIMSLLVSTNKKCIEILTEQIMKLYDVVFKCINFNFDIEIENDIEIEKIKNKHEHIEYLNTYKNKFYEYLQKIFYIINKDNENKMIITLQIFNVISLQCVILLTEIVLFKDFYKNNAYTYSNMQKYPIPTIITLYNNIKKIDWFNYETILLFLKNYDESPEITDEMKRYFGFLPNDLVPVKTNYSCPILESNNPIIYTLIGELSLLQILNSYAHNIYLIGIVTDISYADGRYYTPFEYMHHDIIHKQNRLRITNAEEGTKYEKKFINHLVENESILKRNHKLDKITIILFLLMHESADEFILFNKTIEVEAEGDKIYDSLFNDSYLLNFIRYTTHPVFIKNKNDNIKMSWKNDNINMSWKNTKFFGGLLPKELFPRKDNLITNPLQIPEFLESAAKIFIKEWNLIQNQTYLQTNKK